MDLILNGFLIGLVICFLPGPIFFGLIQLSIERGAKAGLIYSLAIWLSDLLYVVVVQKGLGYVSEYASFKLILGVVGAIILVGFGISIFVSPLKKQKLDTIGLKSGLGFFMKGFAINVFNPFVIVLWIGILSNIGGEPISRQWSFVGAMLFVVAVTDVIKAYSAGKIGTLMNDKNLVLIKRISGSLLGLLGIALFVRTIMSL